MEVKPIGNIASPDGSIHQKSEVYSPEGGLGSIEATAYKDPPKIMVEGNLDFPQWQRMHRVILNTNGVSKCLFADAGGNDKCIKIYEEKQMAEDPRIIDVYNHRDITDNGISGTITTNNGLGQCGVFAVVETNRCIQAGTLEGGTYANMHEQSKRVYDTDGAAPTMHTCGGGNLEPKILEPQAMHLVRSEECKAKRRETKDQGMSFKEGKYAEPRTDGMLNALTTVEKDNYIAMPLQVKVRKYPVDVEGLKALLRSHKHYSSVNELAENLDLPKTTIEHWFRTDDGFAIPDEDVWMKLKDLLHISTDEFDQSIMEFEYQDGKYDMRNRLYVGDVAPTIETGDGKMIKDNPISETPDYRIRKLTERECMRLMGVKDEDSDRVHKNQSKSSMYHLAGDSIVTGVLMGIFGEMCGVDYKSKINDLVDDLTKEKRNESHS